eukprot:341295-Amphidinium_carterae.1
MEVVPWESVFARAMVWNIWLVLCTLVAAPAAVYAAVKAIPGFLLLRGTQQWFVDGSLFFITALSESFGLVRLAQLLRMACGAEVDE